MRGILAVVCLLFVQRTASNALESDDIDYSEKSFLCYAWCYAACLSKLTIDAQVACQNECAVYNSNNLCIDAECWSNCHDLGRESSSNSSTAIPIPMELYTEQARNPVANPYKINITWVHAPGAVLYVLQHNTPGSPWRNIHELIIPTSADDVRLDYVFTKDALCSDDAFRVAAVTNFGVGNFSGVVQSKGTVPLRTSDYNSIVLPKNAAKRVALDAQPIFGSKPNATIDRVYIQAENGTFILTADIGYDFPFGWRSNDYLIEAYVIPVINCVGQGKEVSKIPDKNQLQLRMMFVAPSVALSCSSIVAIQYVSTICDKKVRFPFGYPFNGDGPLRVPIEFSEFCKTSADKKEIQCRDTAEPNICMGVQYLSDFTYMSDITHIEDCNASVLIRWSQNRQTEKSRWLFCPPPLYYVVRYGHAEDGLFGLANFVGAISQFTVNATQGTTNESYLLEGLNASYKYVFQVSGVIFDDGQDDDAAFNQSDGKPSRSQIIDLPKAAESCGNNLEATFDGHAGHDKQLVLVICLPLLITITLIGILTFCIAQHVRRSRKNTVLQGFLSADGEYITMPAGPINDVWELDRRRLIIDEADVLGKGAFGKVFKGKMRGIVVTHRDALSQLTEKQSLAIDCDVAIKQCYEYADDMAKQEFLSEISLMKRLGRHDKLVNMLHCITKSEPFCLVVEYCSEGDLLHYLRDRRKYMIELEKQGINVADASPDEFDADMVLSLKDCVSFSYQIADGMEYLSQKGFLHRDIAARNVLVDVGRKAKVGDFGLCRYVYNETAYVAKGGKLPIKWMALEAIERYEFTLKSDIWSFGVLMFEIITLGGAPYVDIMPMDGDFRKAMIHHLKSGKRMERPDNCPPDFYDDMYRCWYAEPEQRPSFTELKETLRQMLESLSENSDGYGFYLDPNRSYYNVTHHEGSSSAKGSGSDNAFVSPDSGIDNNGFELGTMDQDKAGNDQDRETFEDETEFGSFRQPSNRAKCKNLTSYQRQSTESGIGMDEAISPNSPQKHYRDSVSSDTALITPYSGTPVYGKGGRFNFAFSPVHYVKEGKIGADYNVPLQKQLKRERKDAIVLS